MTGAKRRNSKRHVDTALVELGRDPHANHGVVNPPVYHASTILFPTLAALESAENGTHPGPTYGRRGTTTAQALEQTVAALDGADKAIALPSGKAAMALTFATFTRAGDHVLVSDNAYGPVRMICNDLMEKFGVETTYFDPHIGSGISKLMRPNTRLVWCESPGSLTFEMSDIPAIAAEARQRGIKVGVDNSWASPYYYKPLDHGADIAMQAGTKYLVGHSDAMVGVLSAQMDDFKSLRHMADALGYHLAPDDCYLALRGIRTLSVRLERHQANGLALAEYFAKRPEVARVIHPARPDHPDHALWQRDFKGASGLFAVVLKPGVSHNAFAAFTDGLELFGMGYSWGGYESLLLPVRPEKIRSAVPWREEGKVLRIHAGLEDLSDLTHDLDMGFDRLHAHG
ncbi:MAG: cystathionine beta-lyase [Candidatus Pacebacteria bacterium]|nr:cystathionine beta-lyase [Candidatus Paceibacterota bacterium]